MKKQVARAVAVLVALNCSIAMADWITTMTEDQFPDRTDDGWNIMVDLIKPLGTPHLADDWIADGTREVRDIHIWTSWNQNVDLTPQNITGIGIGIWSDSDNDNLPDIKEWYTTFTNPDGWNVVDDSTPDADDDSVDTDDIVEGGWYNPFNGASASPPDGHSGIYRVDVNDLLAFQSDEVEYFTQQNGETYWLSVVIGVADSDVTSPGPELGWHTARDYSPNSVPTDAYGNPALWLDDGTWRVVTLPDGNVADLAFLTTPEPSALGLLVLCGVSLMSTRSRRKHTET